MHKISLTYLFQKNDLLHFITSSGLENDPLHLNSVYPAKKSTDLIKKGDLLLSLRHKSMLLVYRPSTEKIIWYKIGPWLNQHSAKFNNKNQIYLFNNNIIDTHYNRTSENAYLNISNEILLHDPINNLTSEIKTCNKLKNINTITSGRVDIIGDIIFLDYKNVATKIFCNVRDLNKISFMVPNYDNLGRMIIGTNFKILNHVLKE